MADQMRSTSSINSPSSAGRAHAASVRGHSAASRFERLPAIAGPIRRRAAAPVGPKAVQRHAAAGQRALQRLAERDRAVRRQRHAHPPRGLLPSAAR